MTVKLRNVHFSSKLKREIVQQHCKNDNPTVKIRYCKRRLLIFFF